MSILVVGKNSFISKHIQQQLKCDSISYDNLFNIDMKKYNTIINCAIHPEYKISTYKEQFDLDFSVARFAKQHNCYYIMFSTRKVYGNTENLMTYNELSPVNPFDFYSDNKHKTENKILNVFGDTSIILRGSNIFGFEYGRTSFFGYCMTQLYDTRKIIYTLNENCKKDFLSIDIAVDIISAIYNEKPVGVYNFSSGYGTTIGSVGKYLINGYCGDIVIKSDFIEDQFILDNTKLKTELNIEIDISDYDKKITNLGKLLWKI